MILKLLVNENFPAPALKVLRESGLAVDAVAELMPGAIDRDVMAYARSRSMCLITFDRDYGELVFARRLPAPLAIIYIRQEPLPPSHAANLVLSLLRDAEAVTGKFVTISERSIRMRNLPVLV